MVNIGEITTRDICEKYKVGTEYAENILKRLQEIGYIKRKDEVTYILIQTESNIDAYIKPRIKEFRPREYDEFDIKDNGKPTVRHIVSSELRYASLVVPVMLKKLLFSVPQIVLVLYLTYIGTIDTVKENGVGTFLVLYVVMFIILFVIVGIPLNIIFRFIEAKILKMNFKEFLLLPKNWFLNRVKDTIEISLLLHPNRKIVLPKSYNAVILELKGILNQKLNLLNHYASIANTTRNQNEFYTSINSSIETLEWMTQFEKYGIFSGGNTPSADLKNLKNGMPQSIALLQERMQKNERQKNVVTVINQIDAMDGHDFEYFCADILRKNGFRNVEVTQGSGDHGVDIFAEKGDISYAIQCKRYDGSVPYKAIQEAYSAKGIYNRDVAVVMTNSTFTQQGIEDAKRLNVKLWDRNRLQEMMK